MAKKHEIYWANEDPAVARAFLYNCRDRDLRRDASGIAKGCIVQGTVGFAVAEDNVPGFSGQVVPFKVNRRCEWRGFELDCMAHCSAPQGAVAKSELRDFNYLVAEVSGPDVETAAQKAILPVVVHQSGKRLINLECSSFQRQGKERLVKLLPVTGQKTLPSRQRRGQ